MLTGKERDKAFINGDGAALQWGPVVVDGERALLVLAARGQPRSFNGAPSLLTGKACLCFFEYRRSNSLQWGPVVVDGERYHSDILALDPLEASMGPRRC